MGQNVQLTGESAREVPAGNCIDKPKPAVAVVIAAASCKWFIGLAKKLSATKPAAAIHHLTAEPERTCYEWVRGKFDPPSRVLIKLLHSDAGWVVLEYLMAGCKARWWLELVRARECAAAYEQRREQIPLPL